MKKPNPFDLNHLLRHAFLAGRGVTGELSKADQRAWAEYDPTECPAFERVLDLYFGPESRS